MSELKVGKLVLTQIKRWLIFNVVGISGDTKATGQATEDKEENEDTEVIHVKIRKFSR